MSDTGTPAHVTASAVVFAGRAQLRSVVVGTAASGQTVKLHNCATTGAAASGNLVAQIDLGAAGSYLFGDAVFDAGIVAIVSGGTPDITVVFR